MNWIRSKVEVLVKKEKTCDPFELAKQKNIHIIEWALHHEIKGFYKYDRKNKYIVINSNLNYLEKRFTCSHELGHSELHPRVNTPFLREKTLFSSARIEVEANMFAVAFLLQECNFSEFRDINQVCSVYGIPKELSYMIKKFY
ncbi:ImmA/IrrE family metallo-endopeptidase [Cytobacillus sp. FSL W7-1323]|uniref:ImmA/IrrE family metallo-endopeptidase n=1 Tax=Cytobacillus sp. FSL W7-1323 TaxID=2921700 RepID=UPI003158D6C1